MLVYILWNFAYLNFILLYIYMAACHLFPCRMLCKFDGLPGGDMIWGLWGLRSWSSYTMSICSPFVSLQQASLGRPHTPSGFACAIARRRLFNGAEAGGCAWEPAPGTNSCPHARWCTPLNGTRPYIYIYIYIYSNIELRYA